MKNLLYTLRGVPAENLGDLLINNCLIREIAKYVNVDVLHSKKDLNVLKKMSCFDLANVRLIESDKNFDAKLLFSILLGKSKYEYFCITPGHLRLQKLQHRLRYIKNQIILFVMQSWGLKCIWICKSLDSLTLPERILEKIISKYIHRYSVRDSLSLANNKLSAEVWPDLAFLIEPNHNNQQEVYGKKLILSFRGDRGENTQKIIELFAVKLMNESGGSSYFQKVICLANVNRDVSWMRQLANKLSSQIPTPVEFIHNSDLSDSLKLYEHDSIVITDRLHVALPAMINGTLAFPFLEQSLDNKILGIYQDMHWNELVIFRHPQLENLSLIDSLKKYEYLKMQQINLSVKQATDKLHFQIGEIFSQ
ncbi:polysaccharide pyruvyl transferase family protein [Anabaenopsis elenkinii]|uniref:Polysaccharide pyruvyl transferase family protein n=1 Tax=Anabaenopsis elenkinii CCIBt3563 TaxID=2779889 RepID=A0A7U3RXR2_9CYAN|nr:polysaccharide pyruvyl transferase family protein [Anabaenopsis elenkinii]QOV21310.1 polysaccharide pyruvyl transferase family protein [Anabaenopsis elenkinii CCIBt3563]